MPSQTYDIYFSGQIMDGNNPAETRQQVGKLFKADKDQLGRLFSGTPIRIKLGVDEETATKYRVAFRKAGALIEIKPSNLVTENLETPNAQVYDQSDPPEELSLLPPNTGSLIDFAPEVIPQPLPDIDHLALASTGSILDESPDPEPPEIDTDGLSMSPANSGTLEDCRKEVAPYPIPDISHLDLDQGLDKS